MFIKTLMTSILIQSCKKKKKNNNNKNGWIGWIVIFIIGYLVDQSTDDVVFKMSQS